MNEEEMMNRLAKFDIKPLMEALLNDQSKGLEWHEVCDLIGLKERPSYSDARSGASIDGNLALKLCVSSFIVIKESGGTATFHLPKEP